MAPLQYTYFSNGLPTFDPFHESFASVYAGETSRDFARIDEFLSERKIVPLANARYGLQREVVLRFTDGLPQNEADACALVDALVDLAQIWAVISMYRDHEKLPSELRTAFFSDPLPDGQRSSGKGRNTLTELYASARFKAAGCSTRKAEPDFMCEFRGVEFGLAVKRFKISNLEQHVRKARRQIQGTGRGGVIVLDVSQSNPVLSKPFVGTVDAYRSEVGGWMDKHFFDPLKRNWKSWGLDQRYVPYVVCFNNGICFGDDGKIKQMSQMYNFVPGSSAAPSKRESVMIGTVHQAIEAVRATLPEATP
ncbi:hypothetical protein [Burkholderia cepacia]|uniref:hypothetical protein n=1 Tax=Burkholderia cepacia TaxID=292 RepID=UPI003D665CCF